MNRIIQSANPAAVALVDRRKQSWPNAVFCTISPNPATKHGNDVIVRGKKTRVQVPYGKLPQRKQYDYCLRVLNEYINTEDTKIFGTWELNKDGNVHFHFILSDPKIKNETSLQIFRRDILNTELVMRNLSNKKMIDYMNNIVFVNDSVEKRIDYITKDMDMNLEIMPYYYRNIDLSSLSHSNSVIPPESSKVEDASPGPGTPGRVRAETRQAFRPLNIDDLINMTSYFNK